MKISLPFYRFKYQSYRPITEPASYKKKGDLAISLTNMSVKDCK